MFCAKTLGDRHSNPRFVFDLVLDNLSGGPSTFAATVTWDGITDNTWSDGTNWDSTLDPPVAADTAAFSSAGNGNTTINLGGTQTINHLSFDNLAATQAYTIGIAGVDTLTFQNGGGIDTTANVLEDQTIAANIVLGDGTANTFRIDTESTTHRVIITGDIDTGTGDRDRRHPTA